MSQLHAECSPKALGAPRQQPRWKKSLRGVSAENLRKRGLSHEERAGEGDDILVARTFVKLGGARFEKLRRELTGIVSEYEDAPGS